MSFEQDRHNYASHAPRAIDTTSGGELRGPLTGGSGNNEDVMRRLDAAMNSPYAIEKLLNRLKQSIYSAREFSAFLKERSILEDRYAQGYKKLVRHASDVIRRTDARQGSYARSFGESLVINERLADNGLQLANSLQIMADELREIAEKSERGRKHWKHTTIDHEKQLMDADTARQKAQDRYNNAAEQYERARAGERTGKFGLKKGSQAEQEQAFKEKVDALDAEYAAKATAAQDRRREYETMTRPNTARSLQDVIAECDAVLALQITKLASLTEKHIVSSGMAVAPIRNGDLSGPEPRGLRHAAQDVDNHKDFLDYMTDGVEPASMKARSRRNTDVDLVHTPVQSTDRYDSRPSLDNSNHRSSYQAPLAPLHDSKAPQLPDIGHDSGFGKSFDAQRPDVQNRNSYLGLGGPPEPVSKTSANSQQTGVIQDHRGTSTASTLPSFDRQTSTAPSLPSFDRAEPIQPSTGFGPPPRSGTTGLAGFGNTAGPHSTTGSKPDGFGRLSGPNAGQNLASNDFTAPQGPPPRSNTMGMGNFGSPTGGRQDGLPPNSSMYQPRHDTMGVQGTNRDATPPRQDPYSNNLTSSTAPKSNAFGPNTYNQPTGPPPRQDTMAPVGRGQMPSVAGGAFSGRGQPAPGSYLDPGRNEGPYGNTAAGRGQSPVQQRNLPSQAPARPALPPNKPVFGMHLTELFRRDESAVPHIVFQCIQAVDTFGMHTEGIYRVPGSTPTVNQLKNQFDHDPSLVRLNTPASFSNDINSVATLLKNFLRDLTDPLMTAAAYQGFISAAKEDDNIMRRDALHQSINGLPDANYATLRVLVLHLHRVAMNSDINKMDMKNLSIVFGPTVMGGANVNDAGWQTKVMETILAHTHDIFDPDE